ncbi:MAG: SDR family oxidoreductase [Pseudomonadales bacterium]|nr:SDR family oxidoreductase [Pseudomonadales bacterium]MDG1444092.1 SDR family oxidoreductase [Pseudomonadales bacterium]
MKDFKDKTVVITGGATGIGFAIAKAFGADGARVVLAEPRLNRLEQSVAALLESGVSASYYQCDVADPQSVRALADYAWKENGQVDVLINNAGIKVPNHPVTDLPLEELHKIFSVNFFGQWHGASIFGKRMIEQGTPASIYNVGSELSFFSSVPNATAYMATKHAVLGLTEGLREELPEFIDVGLIVPGFVGTEMHTAEAAALGMDADHFAALVMPQIRAGERFVVSHAYNIEHINARFEAISNAYSNYAPRYDGDDAYDVKTLITRRGS